MSANIQKKKRKIPIEKQGKKKPKFQYLDEQEVIDEQQQVQQHQVMDQQTDEQEETDEQSGLAHKISEEDSSQQQNEETKRELSNPFIYSDYDTITEPPGKTRKSDNSTPCKWGPSNKCYETDNYDRWRTTEGTKVMSELTEVQTVSDGNCMFHAFRMVIREHILENQREETKDEEEQDEEEDEELTSAFRVSILNDNTKTIPEIFRDLLHTNNPSLSQMESVRWIRVFIKDVLIKTRNPIDFFNYLLKQNFGYKEPNTTYEAVERVLKKILTQNDEQIINNDERKILVSRLDYTDFDTWNNQKQDIWVRFATTNNDIIGETLRNSTGEKHKENHDEKKNMSAEDISYMELLKKIMEVAIMDRHYWGSEQEFRFLEWFLYEKYNIKVLRAYGGRMTKNTSRLFTYFCPFPILTDKQRDVKFCIFQHINDHYTVYGNKNTGKFIMDKNEMGNIAQIYNKSNSCENALLFPTYTDDKMFFEYIIDRAQGPRHFKIEIATRLLQLTWGNPPKKIYNWEHTNPTHILGNLNIFVNIIDTFMTDEHKQLACNYLCQDIRQFCKIEQAKDFMGKYQISVTPYINNFIEDFFLQTDIKHPIIIKKERKEKLREEEQKQREERKKREDDERKKHKDKKTNGWKKAIEQKGIEYTFNYACMGWLNRQKKEIKDSDYIPKKNNIEESTEINQIMKKIISYFLGLARRQNNVEYCIKLFECVKYSCMLLFYFMNYNNIKIQEEFYYYITRSFENHYATQTHPYSLMMQIFNYYRDTHTRYDDVKQYADIQLWPIDNFFVDITAGTAYKIEKRTWKWKCVGIYSFVKNKFEPFTGSIDKYGFTWNYVEIWNEDKKKMEIEIADDNGDRPPTSAVIHTLKMHFLGMHTSLQNEQSALRDLLNNDWYGQIEYLIQLQEVIELHELLS